jgi:acetylglutamate kinase
VISVLGGIINTRFVAALTSAGVAAVGLTGADAGCGVVTAAGPHRTTDGQLVDLGRVGVPDQAADGRLLTTLVTSAFVPVIASIGLGVDGRLYNVNADTFAGDVAARLKARRLVIAGTTPGVLDRTGATIATLDRAAMTEMIDSGAATAGMIAKLRACEAALSAGVGDVVIVDGRDGAALEAAALGNVLDEAPGAAAYETLAGGPLTATRLVAATGVGRESWPR